MSTYRVPYQQPATQPKRVVQYAPRPQPSKQPALYHGRPLSPPGSPESSSLSGDLSYSNPSSGTNSGASSFTEDSIYPPPSYRKGVHAKRMVQNEMSQAYDPSFHDRQLAQQAQMSGQLNAKNREIMALREQVRIRHARLRANVEAELEEAEGTQEDLEWTQEKIASLNAMAARKYPEQYRAARQRYQYN